MEFLELCQRIFLQNDAWVTLLRGAKATVQITAWSLLLGTLLGAVVCFCRLAAFAPLAWGARGYIALLRGSPVLMLLLLLFYGVMAGTDFAPETVAVLAFGLNTSAHVAELLRTALSALPRGEVEAARTLGFSRWQAFRYVTLPQLVHLMKPVYQSTVVNLMQWTSVVGYVTITDLTRVINNMASRTMQPLLVISAGMLLYLLMSYAVYGLFALSDWWGKRQKAGEEM